MHLLSRRTIAGLLSLATLSGCGAAQSTRSEAAHSRAANATTPTDPAMVMVTLGDLGFRASTVDMTLHQQVMVMVVNRGVEPHQLQIAMHVGDLQVDDPASARAPHDTLATSPTVDIAIAGGHEIDATFVPVVTGRFGMILDQTPAGQVIVTSSSVNQQQTGP